MIYQRQYTKLLAQEILRYMLMGQLPNMGYIATRVASALGNAGDITYKYIPQPSRSVFQNQVYNKGLRKIKFDIDTLHEEVMDLISKATDRMSYADLYHKVNSHELAKLESQLKSLLFTIQNADFYFLGAFESFSDISKLDITSSTESIIDLAEGCIALPYGGKNTQRIKATHLFNQLSWPIEVIANTTISNNQIPGTSFSNMFSDMISAWGYEVVTSSAEPVTIRFRFPLAGNANQEIEVLINRIELIPHSSTKQTAVVKLSNDNVNYIPPLGYENGIVVEDQKITYALDFESTLTQYVEVSLTKNTPDSEIVDGGIRKYQYLFGLKSISALQVGRISSGVYQSKPFGFTDEEEKISKVSIQSEAWQPPGTRINYSVALANESDTPVTSFVPIIPVDTNAASIGVSQVVNFGTTTFNSRRFTTIGSGEDSPQEYGRPFQGKTFYRVSSPITPKPIFNSSKLYRGFKAWHRDSSQGFELTDVSDIYISFEESDVESVYTWLKESASTATLPVLDGVRRVQLTLSKPVYYNSNRGHLMKPPAGITNTSIDIKPNYAISKVSLTGPSSRRTKPFLLENSRTQNLPATNFIVQSVTESDLPVLRAQSGQIYARNIDYVILTEDINGRQVPTGSFRIPDGSALLNANGTVATPTLAMEFEYTNDADITHKVTAIQDSFITLSNLVVNYDDNIEITYRYIPSSPSEILKASIRVSNLPSTASNRVFYVEGKDYIISASDGGIQRIPTGSIGDKSSVYVMYTYRNATLGIETFTTWCNITDSGGVQLKFEVNDTSKTNKLVADLEVGEGFYVNTPQGLLNLTKAINTPVLGPGWIQFVVRSKNPTSNQNFRTNLINQVIQLRDINNKKIFRDNNFYFKEISAFRDPLKEISLNHLKVNTLKSDHTSFAIDSTTSVIDSYIVLNFLPNGTDELYCYGPTEDTDSTNNPGVIPEEFMYQWESKAENNLIGSKVIVRIELERNSSTDGSITPKVFEYKLRASI